MLRPGYAWSRGRLPSTRPHGRQKLKCQKLTGQVGFAQHHQDLTKPLAGTSSAQLAPYARSRCSLRTAQWAQSGWTLTQERRTGTIGYRQDPRIHTAKSVSSNCGRTATSSAHPSTTQSSPSPKTSFLPFNLTLSKSHRSGTLRPSDSGAHPILDRPCWKSIQIAGSPYGCMRSGTRSLKTRRWAELGDERDWSAGMRPLWW